MESPKITLAHRDWSLSTHLQHSFDGKIAFDDSYPDGLLGGLCSVCSDYKDALCIIDRLKNGNPDKTYRFNIQQGIEMGRGCDVGVSVGLDESGKGVSSLILAGSAVLVSQGTLTLLKS